MDINLTLYSSFVDILAPTSVSVPETDYVKLSPFSQLPKPPTYRLYRVPPLCSNRYHRQMFPDAPPARTNGYQSTKTRLYVLLLSGYDLYP